MGSIAETLDTLFESNSRITSTVRARHTNGHLCQHHLSVILSRKSGHVLASSTNYATSLAPPGTFSVHAEVAALAQLHQRLRAGVVTPRDLRKGVCVFSLRFTNKGELSLARPCERCARALRRDVFVRKVVWSEDGGGLSQLTF